MGRGRPTKYKKEFCKIILEKMENGDSVVSCCAEIGISRETFYDWVKTHKDFSDTYNRGMVLAEKYWENIGKQGVLGIEVRTKDGKTGRVHPGMYAFFMKNRFHWTDRVDVTADVNATVDDIAALSPEERRRRIAELMQKANV